MGRLWNRPPPPGVVDPLFMHELALELHMSVRQLGEAMDIHELSVSWPLYFAAKQRLAEREERLAQATSRAGFQRGGP